MAHKRVAKVVSFRIMEKDSKELKKVIQAIGSSKSEFLRSYISNVLSTIKKLHHGQN